MNRVRLSLSILIGFLFVTITLAQNQFSRSGAKYKTVYASSALEDTIEIHYDGENFDAIGLTAGGTFEVAAKFIPDLLEPLTGGKLVQLKIYINDLPTSATMKIYGAGTATTPGPLLHTQPLTTLTGLSWNTITLSAPLAINGQDLWVGYEVTHIGGINSAGCDAGPAIYNGDWIYHNGIWARLSVIAPTLNYNWNIRALIEEPVTGGPGNATNPSPSNGATLVPINLSALSWTNPAGTIINEVIFNGTTVYSGPAVTSYPVPGPLTYNTNYTWRVRTISGTGTTNGRTWNFTTTPNTNLAICDDFDEFEWTPIGPLGNTNWGTNPTYNAGGTSPELRFNWNPSFVGVSKLLSPLTNNPPAGDPVYLTFRHMVDWYSTTFTLGVGYTTDGGTNVTTLWTISPTGNVGPEYIIAPTFISPGNFQFVIWFSGDSFEIDYWYIDDFCAAIIPVELNSFTASAQDGSINLKWSTSTETNNEGFEVQKKVSGADYSTIAFIEGHGTTAQIQNYTYSDQNISNGTYTYRLKQIDHNGTFEYSNEVEVDVNTPAGFALNQNYPNPFNPSTSISFSLAVDSKVSLKIFDVLGQEVENLLNTSISAGAHTLNFDASNLISGTYFYQIEASGIDGTNFFSVKKMMLTK